MDVENSLKQKGKRSGKNVAALKERIGELESSNQALVSSNRQLVEGYQALYALNDDLIKSKNKGSSPKKLLNEEGERRNDAEDLEADYLRLQAEKRRNKLYGNNLAGRESIRSRSEQIFEHNFEKLEKSRNASRTWKKAGIWLASITGGTLGIGIAWKIFAVLHLGPLAIGGIVLALACIAGIVTACVAASYKRDYEQKQAIGLAQRDTELRRGEVTAQSTLITNAHSSISEIQKIQQNAIAVQPPYEIEGVPYYKREQKKDDSKKKDDDKKREITLSY